MFISFEGTEGVGKSTLIATLQKELTILGFGVVLTREPGGTPLAEKIRQLLLHPDQEIMSPTTELLLLYAARAQHLAQVILPALKQGKIVLCDRFVDASLAYQHGGRELPREDIDLLTQKFVQKLPDVTFWLDAPVEVGMQRAKNRGELDRFEQEKLAFFGRVRAVYTSIAKDEPQRIVRLDATQTADIIAQEALMHLQAKLTK